MNTKKLLILIILAVFCIGMTMGTVDSAKIVKCGKYKCKLTKKDLKKIKNNGVVWKKTGKYYTYKKPFYKKKKVKKYKWVTKKVLESETWDYDSYDYDSGDSDYWSDSEEYLAVNKYWTSSKWKYCGSCSEKCGDSYYNNYDNGYQIYNHYKYYTKFKKKVPYYTYKKVKTGKYKNVKVPIYMVISKNFQDGWGYCIDVKTKNEKFEGPYKIVKKF